MSPTRNRKTVIPDQLAQDIARVSAEVEAQERRGQFNTPHHEVLRNLLEAQKQQPQTDAEDEKE